MVRLIVALVVTLGLSLAGGVVGFFAAPSVIQQAVGPPAELVVTHSGALFLAELWIASALAVPPWLGLIAAFVDHLGLRPVSARVVFVYLVSVWLGAALGIVLKARVDALMLMTDGDGLRPMISIDSLGIGETGWRGAVIVFAGALAIAVVRRRRLQQASRP